MEKKDAKVLVAAEAVEETAGVVREGEDELGGNAELPKPVNADTGAGVVAAGGGGAGFGALGAGANEKGVVAAVVAPKPEKPENLDAGAEGWWSR